MTFTDFLKDLNTDKRVLFVVDEEETEGVYDFYADEISAEDEDRAFKVTRVTTLYDDGTECDDTIYVTIRFI